MDHGLALPPFPGDYRASGLLLHVTSLPTPYGIGDVGPAALTWIDRLAAAGQSWWQSLPLGPTGYGNSPYEPLSSFASNRLLISPDWLIEDELVRASDCQQCPTPYGEVNFDTVIPFKVALLKAAWASFKSGARADLRPAYEQFCRDEAYWLEDYALFRVLRTKFCNAHCREWPTELLHRQPAALDAVRRDMADEINAVCFAQFLLFRQSARLKAYAHAHGVGLIGDLPFYVSSDSSDVWAHPELFLLNAQRRPDWVGGVPPDYFSADGQLWGNPVYNWDVLRQSNYDWYISRLRSLLLHVDMIRLDHFRGFVAAWHVRAGSPNARSGQWVPGPGDEFFRTVEKELGVLPFIVEDLGMITPDVYAVRDRFQLPGSRVLQFAFDGHADNPYLPRNYVRNTVVYTGTHDNPPTRSWYEDLPEYERQNLLRYLNSSAIMNGDASRALMNLAWSSPAALAIAPLQDLLNLGGEARMNVPGQAEGNWRWRATPEMLADPAFERLYALTSQTQRLARKPPAVTQAPA